VENDSRGASSIMALPGGNPLTTCTRLGTFKVLYAPVTEWRSVDDVPGCGNAGRERIRSKHPVPEATMNKAHGPKGVPCDRYFM
jgi:hypothetical protein